MFDISMSRRQVGIRQRSLRRHCRPGRATELVFVLAMGGALVLSGGQAQAQATFWDGDETSWDSAANWDNGIPAEGGTAIINFLGTANPTLNVDSNALAAIFIDEKTLTVNATLTSTDVILSGGNMTINATGNVVGAVTVNNAGTLQLNGGNVTDELNLTGGGILRAISDSTLTGTLLDVVPDGTGTITADAGVTLTVATEDLSRRSNSNTTFGTEGVDGTVVLAPSPSLTVFSGSTVTVAGGTLKFGNGNSAGFYLTATSDQMTTAVNAGATIDMNGFVTTIGNLSGAGTITNEGADARRLILENLPGDDTTFSGVIKDGAGAVELIKTREGVLTLSGANTFTGLARVNRGELNITGSLATRTVQAAGDGRITVNGNSISDTVRVELLDRSILSLAADETIGSIASGNLLSADTPTPTVLLDTHTLTLSSGEAGSVGSGTGSSDFEGTISGTGGVTVTGGTHDLSGATTDFTGAITVTGGQLDVDRIASTAADVSGGTLHGMLSAGTGLTISGDGAFINGNDQTIASINQSGGTLSGDRSLTISGNYNLSGGSVTIADPSSSPTVTVGSFTQTGGTIGAGTTVTSAGAKTLEGGTIAGTLNGGGATTIQTGTTMVTGSIAGDVTLASGTLRLGSDNAVTGTITSTGSTIDYADGVTRATTIVIASDTTQVQVNIGTATQSGVISENGGSRPLEKVGGGTLTLTAANTYTGTTTINAGAIEARNDSALGNGDVLVDGGALRLSGSVTIGNDLTLNGTGVGGDGALRNVSGDNTLTGAIGLTGATRINSDADLLALDGAITGTDTNLTLGGAGDISINSGADIGTATFTKDGAGIATVTSTINALEAIVSEGSLVLTGASALNAFVTIGAGGTLSTDGGALFGPVTNDGVMTLTGDETFDLQGSGLINLDGGNLTIRDSGSTVFSGVIQGTGGVTIASGTVGILSGVNTYSGDTTVNDLAQLLVNGTSLLDTGAVVLNGTGDLFLSDSEVIGSLASTSATSTVTLGANTLTTGSANTSTTFAGVISGAGGLTKVGTGTMTLSGENTNAGVTTITAGTLQVGSGGTTGRLGTGAVTNNAALVFNRSNDQTVSNVISGTGTVRQVGSGTTTLSGENTYTGKTTVAGGVLNLTGSITSTEIEISSGTLMSSAAGLAADATVAVSGGT